MLVSPVATAYDQFIAQTVQFDFTFFHVEKIMATAAIEPVRLFIKRRVVEPLYLVWKAPNSEMQIALKDLFLKGLQETPDANRVSPRLDAPRSGRSRREASLEGPPDTIDAFRSLRSPRAVPSARLKVRENSSSAVQSRLTAEKRSCPSRQFADRRSLVAADRWHTVTTQTSLLERRDVIRDGRLTDVQFGLRRQRTRRAEPRRANTLKTRRSVPAMLHTRTMRSMPRHHTAVEHPGIEIKIARSPPTAVSRSPGMTFWGSPAAYSFFDMAFNLNDARNVVVHWLSRL